ncbi:delta-9 desaturase [Jimgerdemannia flammicorona]|uniref:Acyl-CoA desaturase n=1 Tax=Jimgerdemannia flammicorona TaxID=994334 RepID=A0A433DMQ8_9FUNG|nr:delta-9 desaturase [Jimgerdemannia flammicorona]
MSAIATMTFTETEMRKPPAPRTKMPPLFDEPTTVQNWYKHINWTQSILLISTPLAAIYGMATTKLLTPTLIWSIIWYFFTGMGVTAGECHFYFLPNTKLLLVLGYHRHWSHRAYSATLPLKIILALTGAGSIQGSVRWWSRGHRAHHRYTDTDKDPYSAHRGVMFSHIIWMLVNRPKSRIGYADVADLDADPVVKWQHKYYPLVALTMAFVFPTLVAGLGWGDWRGGYFYAGMVRLVFLHHATFCVNSLAHWLGETPFDDHHTPRDHFITAFVTLGEGYHNFHHEFPQDYRNAILFYQYDPTKWFIKALSFIGLAYDLKKFPQNEVVKGQVYMAEKKINKIKEDLNWGVPIHKLPVFTWDEFQELTKQGKQWILIEGVLYDVSKFIDEHPGGPRYIKTAIGKDMTTAFNGAVYNHSNGARNLMSTMRIGVIRGGMEVENMKKDPIEEILDPKEYA